MIRLGAIAALATILGCAGPGEVSLTIGLGDDPVVAAPAAPVAVAATYVGVLTARKTAVVAAESGGRVLEILVHMGDRVEVGAPIARLDPAPILQKLAAARAAADAAGAAARGASLDVADARHRLAVERRLLREGITAREVARTAEVAVAKARTGAAGAAAAHREATAQVAELERQLAGATLTAPVAGVVSVLKVREGDRIDPGTGIVRIFDPTELALRFAVPAEHAERVRSGQPVTLVASDSGVAVRGVIRHVAPELEPPLRLVLVEADVASSEELRALTIQSGVVGRVALGPPSG